ncbi:hypothetical protein LEP1GSC018_3936 [Leptospira kirschneri str. 2008720114]|nr:hypothetical protein LEP1GSC018_3936 [Leptospira kirschneri str. 2008720114]
MQKFDWTVILYRFYKVIEKKENRKRQFSFQRFYSKERKILSIWFRNLKNDSGK